MNKSFSSIIEKINNTPDDQLTSDKIKKAVERVAWLCVHKPWVKGSYSGLVQAYWRKFYGVKIWINGEEADSEKFRKLLKTSSPETIGRAFRKLSEQTRDTEYARFFQPSDEKRHNRSLRQLEMRHIMPRVTVSVD